MKTEQFENLQSENIKKTIFSKEFIKNCFAVSIFSFGFNFLTTAEYVNFQEIFREIGFTSATKISILLAASLTALCIGAILGGFFNDKIKSKFGQRIPSIFLGTIIASILLLIIPIFTQTIDNLEIIYYCLFGLLIIGHLFLGAAYTPWLALIADLFLKKERTIVGISINIFGAIGAAIATILFSTLIDNGKSWIIWLVIGFILSIVTIISALILPKTNHSDYVKSKITDLFRMPRLIWKYGGITWSLVLIVNIFWSFSSHLVETGIVDSLISRFSVTDTSASLASNILMGGYIVVFLLPTIWIINKIGKIKASIFTTIFYSVFCVLLATMQNFNAIYYIIIIGGIGNIFLSTLQIALPADLVPKGREASFMGIFFAMTTAVKPLATLVQGLMIENNENQMTLQKFNGYPGTFLLAAIICLSTLILLYYAIKNQEKHMSFNLDSLEKLENKEKGIEMKTSQTEF